MVKTALHKGQVMFLQLNPTPGRLNLSMNTSLDSPDDCTGWQDPISGNTSTRAQVVSPKKSSEEEGSLIVLTAGDLGRLKCSLSVGTIQTIYRRWGQE